MPRIFISYRRKPSAGLAGRLFDRLEKEFGHENVFLDSETIPLGETFDSFILENIKQCDVFLAMFAQGTFDRIHVPNDWVRREIAFALSQPNIRVIPFWLITFQCPIQMIYQRTFVK
jgi:hypothetical protein